MRYASVKHWINILVLAVTTLFATSAFALDCDSIFVDETGKVPDSDGSILRAATLLAQKGETDVRIRVTQGASSVKGYKDTNVTQCRSWQASNGDIKRNLVVVVLAMNPNGVGFYYGRGLDNIFSSHDMPKEYMVPVLKRRDLSGGIVAGLDGARQLILNARTPVKTVVQQVPVQQPAPVVAPVIVKEQPTDFTGLWIVLEILTLGGIAWYVMSILSQRKRERDACEAAQQRAQQEQNACNTAILNLPERIRLMQAIVVGQASKLDSGACEKLTRDANAAQSEYDLLSQKIADASTQDASADMSEEAYGQIEQRFAKLNTSIDRLSREVQRLQQEAEQIDQMISRAEKSVTDLESRIGNARTSLTAVTLKGFNTITYSSALDKAVTALGEAKATLAAKRYAEVSAIIGTADTFLQEALTAEKLEERVETIGRNITSYERRIASVKNSSEQARATLAELQRDFAASSIQSVSKHERRIAEHVNGAEKLLPEMRTAISMKAQEWEKAEKLLFAGGRFLDQAESFIQSITQLQANLIEARDTTGQRITAAEQDIARADTYNREHDDDIDDVVWTNLDNARGLIANAKTQMALSKPNYLEIIELIRQADEIADHAMEQCLQEHEAADRLRSRAQQSIRDAQRYIADAREYIADHQYNISGDSATKALALANEQLEAAKKETNTKQKLEQADAATTSAKEALSEAKRNRIRTTSSQSSYGSTRSTTVHHHHYDSDRSGNDLTAMAIGYAIGSSQSSSQRDYGGGSSSTYDSDDRSQDTGGGTSSIFSSDPDPSPSFGGSESSFSIDTSTPDMGSGSDSPW